MAFLNKSREENNQEDNEPQKIKIGDQEFSEEELGDVLQTYKKVEEVQKNHGDLDKIVSELGRRADEVGKYKKQVEEYEKQLEDIQKGGSGDEEERPEKPSLPENVVTTENLMQYLDTYNQAQRLIKQGEELEQKLNPYEAEELPKFDSKDMFNWMRDNGLSDPEKAYKIRYESEIDEWKQKSLDGAKPKGITTDESSAPGNKEPEARPLNNQNLKEMIRATLSSSQE